MATTQIDLGHQALAGTLTNTQVSSSAAIAFAKLASMSTGQILLGNAGVATATTLGGDATVNATGLLTIANGAITDAKVNAAAAIAFSKLAALATGQLLVGNGGVATATTLSGDATISSSGVITIANNAITTAKIADANVTDAKLATSYIKADGTRALTGSWNVGGFNITGLAAPSVASDATTKSYVDNLVNGVTWKNAARLATTTALAANTYANGTAGVGATLTANANGALSVDGVGTALNDRILVKNEVTASHNGIYSLTQLGDGSNPYILTRVTDYDQPSEAVAGTAVFIQEGTANADSGWIQTTTGTITIGTSSLLFTQFTSLGQIVAGSGLTETGNTISVLAGDGISLSSPINGSVNVLSDPTGGANLARAINVGVNGVAVKIDSTTIVEGASNRLAVNVGTGANQIVQLDGSSKLPAVDGSALTNLNASNISSGTLSVSRGGTGTGTTFTQGSVVFSGASGTYSQDNAKFFWDDTNFRLGIGNASPGKAVDVTGDVRASVQLISTVATGTAPLAVSSTTLVSNLNSNFLNGLASSDFLRTSASSAVTTGNTLTINSGATLNIAGIWQLGGTTVTETAAQLNAIGSIIIREVPSGTIDGSNAVFTLAHTPISATEEVFLNGLLQNVGGGNDYTISSGTITFASAPVSGSVVLVNYRW